MFSKVTFYSMHTTQTHINRSVPFLSKHFSQSFSPPHCIWQTVVNFISELQEQICQFQKEINSKIQEKKALEIPADSRFPVECPAESTESQDSNLGGACDKTSGMMSNLEVAPNGPDGNTATLEEASSDAEQKYYCGGESVGIARSHDLYCITVHSMCCVTVVCGILRFRCK